MRLRFFIFLFVVFRLIGPLRFDRGEVNAPTHVEDESEYNADARESVDHGEDFAERCGRNEAGTAYGRECHDAEIQRINVAEVFLPMVEHRSG